MFLILGFLMGLTAGFTVVQPAIMGAGNMKAMRQSVASAAILSAAVSLFDDGGQYGNDETYPALDEYTGRYV